MATFTVNGKLTPATTTIFTVRTSLSRNRIFLPPSSFRVPRTISTLSPRVPYLKCSTNTELSSKFIAKPLAVSVSLTRGSRLLALPNGVGDGNDWGKLDDDDKEQSPVWDHHGLPENITVQLNELDSSKKYKISEITFFDETTQITSGTEDILFELLSICSGGIYTKDDLIKELEMLASSTMFKKVNLEGKTKPDGTLGVIISLEENTWPSPERFRFNLIDNVDEEQSSAWDCHELSDSKRYKISYINFVDFNETTQTTSGTGYIMSYEILFEIIPGGIYTKDDLVELESLSSSTMFKKVDLELKTNPDGTLGVFICLEEPSPQRFRFTNLIAAKVDDNVDEKQSSDWDCHELSDSKEYKISDITFFDETPQTTSGTEYISYEMLSIIPGGIYTKDDLMKLESTVFKDLELKMKPDGTLGVLISLITSKDDNVDEEQSLDWDFHMPSELMKYKISEITFFDETTQTTSGTEDIFYEMLSIIPGGIYTKDDLVKELEILSSSIMFKKVDMDLNPKPDGTLGVIISLEENTWPSPERFRFTNIRVMKDPVMTDQVNALHIELMKMVRDEGRLTGSLLLRLRHCVHEWYHDQGYVCAKLVKFTNLDARVVEFEVEEGNITLIEFLDELGNVIQDSLTLSLLRNKLPYQLCQGEVYNVKAGNQAIKNIISSELFSIAEVNTCVDEKNKGGIIVEIKLTEEAKITQIVIEFQDELGNVIQDSTKFKLLRNKLPNQLCQGEVYNDEAVEYILSLGQFSTAEIISLVRNKLPNQLCQGEVYNDEAGKQAVDNILSLGLFSTVQVIPRVDEKNRSGIIVEIKLTVPLSSACSHQDQVNNQIMELQIGKATC